MAIKSQITIRTNFTPPITFDADNKQDSRGGINALLKLLKPSIDGTVPILGNVHRAPWGEPTQFGGFIAFGIIALAAFGAYHFVKRGI